MRLVSILKDRNINVKLIKIYSIGILSNWQTNIIRYTGKVTFNAPINGQNKKLDPPGHYPMTPMMLKLFQTRSNESNPTKPSSQINCNLTIIIHLDPRILGICASPPVGTTSSLSLQLVKIRLILIFALSTVKWTVPWTL